MAIYCILNKTCHGVFWVSFSFCLIHPVVAPTIPSDLTTQPPCQGKYQLQGTFDSPIGEVGFDAHLISMHMQQDMPLLSATKQGLKCIQEYQMTSLDTKQLTLHI